MYLYLKAPPPNNRSCLPSKRTKKGGCRLIETELTVVDVVEHKLIWPSNPWSDDLRLWDVGRWQQQNIKRGIRGIGFKVLAQAGLGNAEIEDLVSNVIKESEDTSRRLYWPV